MIVVSGTEGCSEHAAALAVRDAFLKLWPGCGETPANEEMIRIASSAKISGYGICDFDILIVAHLKPGRMFVPKRVLRDGNKDRIVGLPINVSGIVAAIEVKDHDPSKTRITGDSIEVRYTRSGPPKWSNATDQNIKQAHAIKSYFADLGARIFVSRALIMRGFDRVPCAAAVGGSFDAAALLTALAESGTIQRAKGGLWLSAGMIGDVERALGAPVFRQIRPSALDRKRMDRIAARGPEQERLVSLMGKSMLRFRGRGGSGKTVMLLQLAWRAFEERAARSVFLTYNLALAADIRRLMVLMNIPGDSADGGIAVRTVMSFSSSWMQELGVIAQGEMRLEDYDAHCETAVAMIREGAINPADIERAKISSPEIFDFDSVIVDEAQDWPIAELELIKALYGPANLCLADGVDQLIRGGAANWEVGVPASQRSVEPLKQCLRMKANLAVFSNSIAERAGLNVHLTPNAQAGGGRVIIRRRPFAACRNFHDQLLSDARAAGNSGVDHLYCVPPASIISENDGGRTSAVSQTLKAWGLEVWDGVDEHKRRDFARSTDALRVVQYESCRGLEGWIVTLEGFDSFWKHIRQHVAWEPKQRTDRQNVLGQDTTELVPWRWCMIPLSRAIDTLVINLDDPESECAQVILAAAASLPDVVEILE